MTPCQSVERRASVAVLLLLVAGAATALPLARYVRFVEARPIVASLSDVLPPELKVLTDSQREDAWPEWTESHDRQIRERLAQGDEETIVNWLLLGTSFTRRPPALPSSVEGKTPEELLRRMVDLIGSRVGDFVRALAAPRDDERRLFARRLLEQKGLRFDTLGGREAVRDYLETAVIRALQRQEELAQNLEAARGDTAATSALRAQLFRTRGLSLDTSLFPNYALEQSLAAMKARGLLKRRAVRRVAIVGPGLDFSDKDTGFDFYPQQMLQPFAVLDSLGRLGLGASPAEVEVVLFDISPRVIDHVTRARARAARGESYIVHLPLARDRAWLPEARRYWETFGDQIGMRTEVRTPTSVSQPAEVRAVRMMPSVVQQISVVDLNVVTQRVDGETFDLVIATNVFIYYEVFEQILAMANVEAMLKPEGVFLANNAPYAAVELGALRMRPVGSLLTLYSRDDVGDLASGQGAPRGTEIIWYQAPAQENVRLRRFGLCAGASGRPSSPRPLPRNSSDSISP